MPPPNESALAAAKDLNELICLYTGQTIPSSVIENTFTKHSAAQQGELEKYKKGNLLEFGDDFGTPPVELVTALKSKVELQQQEMKRLKQDLKRFTADGLLDCHMICDQRDKAVQERDELKAEQTLAAIQAGIDNEFKTGERSGDILQDFQMFIEHHNVVEALLAKSQKANDYMANQLQLAGHGARERLALEVRLAEMEKALRAHLQVNPRGGLPPKRLDEALSWVENDRIVTEMVNKALTTTMNVCTKCDQWIIKGQICTDATLTQHANCENPWPKSTGNEEKCTQLCIENEALRKSIEKEKENSAYWVAQHGMEAEKRGAAEHELDLARGDKAKAFEDLERERDQFRARVVELEKELKPTLDTLGKTRP